MRTQFEIMVTLTCRKCFNLMTEGEKGWLVNIPRMQSTKLILNAQRGSEHAQGPFSRDYRNCATKNICPESPGISRTRSRALDSNIVKAGARWHTRKIVSSELRGTRLFIDNRKCKKRVCHFTNKDRVSINGYKKNCRYFVTLHTLVKVLDWAYVLLWIFS